MPARLRQRLQGHGDILVVAAIWLPLAAGAAAADYFALIGNFPFLAAKQGEASDESIWVLLFYASANFFLLVVPLVYSTLRWRERGSGPPGDKGDSPVQPRTHWLFPPAWTGYAALVGAVAIVFPGVTGLLAIWKTFDEKPDLRVSVVAAQWHWTFRYPRYGLEVTDQLVLPLGARTRFAVSSADVIHSFWIPAFRIKWDAIPGETRNVTFTPTKVASTAQQPLLRVQCAELCGVGHPDMQATVRIVPPAQFQAWVRRQKAMQAQTMSLTKRLMQQQMSRQGGGG